MTNPAFQDAFNLLCGEKLGSGVHRDVFACRLRDDLVVKVEIENDWRYFSNVHEMKFWSDNQHYDKMSRWLAPCEYLSPDGRILLQHKARIATEYDTMPAQLPAFLTDIKHCNYGFIGDRFVCVDYAITLGTPNLRLRKVDWT